VVETSAADEANIIPGDVVISINNKTIKVKQDLIEILKTKYAGDVVNLKIYRQGNISTKNVKLKRFPDPGFKPLWVEGSKKLKNPKQKNYGLENVILVGDDTILYPKHFSKKVLSKYNHENLVVVCVQKGSDNTFKNYDQILSIEGQNPKKGYSLTDKPVQVKFKRGNKIFDKKITPTVFNTSLDIRHDCNSEFALYDCLIDYNAAWKLDKKNRGAAWRKTLKCLEKTSPVPFGDIFSKGKQPKISMKLDTITWTLGYLQYNAPDLKSKNNLNEINKILVFAKEQLKEFEKFQEIYPGHLMSDSYDDLLNAITRATNWAAGNYSDDLKSTQDTTIQTDNETVKSIKLTLERKIKNTKIDSAETVKFLVSKSTYLAKANEIDYLIKKYEQVVNLIDWDNKNLSKYFDNIYNNLSDYYLMNSNIEASLNILDKGLAEALNNYNNLYFKSAYTELISLKYFILLAYKPTDLINEQKVFVKIIEKHLSHLDALSKEDNEKLKKIDKDSYFGNLITLQLLKLTGDMDDMTFYPLKMLDYIKSNPKQNHDLDYAMALSFLLQAAIIEDDIKNFLYSRNEIAILYAESQGNLKKLNNLKTISTMLIQSYESTGFYSDSDKFINFISDNFTIDKQIKENQLTRNSFIMYSFYRGISAIRSENFKKAEKIFKESLINSNVKSLRSQDLSRYSLSDAMVALKFLPQLIEIYFNQKNFKEFNKINNIIFEKDIDDISKKDLKLYSDIGLNTYKVFKIYLKYFKRVSNDKKFKLVESQIDKNLDKTIKILKENNKLVLLNESVSRESILKEIVQIAEILISNNYKKEGVKILNKIYPVILDHYNEKSSQLVWKPNINDNIFGVVYLDVAENYLQNDKAFFKKAYFVAQAGKNLFNSRDVSQAIAKKSFKDPEGLIERYEDNKRELSVNLRSQQYTPSEIIGNSTISKELNTKSRELQIELVKLEKEIDKKIPSYFKLIKLQSVKISEIQSLLKNDEVLLDYYFYEEDLKVVSITKDNFKISSNKIDLKKLNKLNKKVRNTLIPSKGILKPYAVNNSFDLNEKVFLFLDKVTRNYKNIIIIPDGPLNSMPLHALAYVKNKDCLDCRNIKFNLSNHNFNYFPSVETFKSIDTVAKEFKSASFNISNKEIKKITENTVDLLKQETGVKFFKKLKSLASKKDNSNKDQSVKQTNTDDFYLGLGDPDLYGKAQAKKINTKTKITMLRSIFENDKINSQSIKEIYGPVDGSADEINQVAKYLSPLKSKILLRENAKEINLKEIDLSTYKIIHFATHGEISGAIDGINEPFLVLSPPTGSSTEDGLLTMSEIMSLDTNANLIVLSACNTASGDEAGSEGFSGLAKSFFMSGSKSVLVSNWYVETYSAKEIVINLFKNLKDNPNSSISNGLNMTMLNMSKNQKDRSHPMFWAPFVVVGKNQPLPF